MKKVVIILSFISIVLITMVTANAEDKKTVNILTWWKYLDDPSTAKLIKDKCGAELSYDNYTANDDMLRRWNTNADKYDILIFSDTIYNAVKDKIILNHSELWKKADGYNQTIRKKYFDSHFPHNIAYFAHSLTGFIWNPKVINLTKDDTVQTAFKKALNNKVILLDDPVEINMLLSSVAKSNLDNVNNKVALIDFKKITQNSRIYISNDSIKIYSQNNFAFSYQWSGASFSRNGITEHYPFLINEHLSYVTADLIAQVKESKVTACVADVLTSKQFLSTLQNKTQYFSPYGNIDTVPEGEFKEAYKNFLNNLPKLRWLEPPSPAQLKILLKKWDEVKYELTQNR